MNLKFIKTQNLGTRSTRPNSMNINCKKCSTPIPLKQEVLKRYAGKVVSISCPVCKNQIRFKVRDNAPRSSSRPAGMETTVITKGAGSAGTKQTKAFLKVIRNTETIEQQFTLSTIGKSTVGRLSNAVNAPRADIAIKTKDGYMSKLHCMIEVEEQNNGERLYILSDYKSTNGTYFEDRRMEENDAFYLNDGDTFRIGRTTILFEIAKS